MEEPSSPKRERWLVCVGPGPAGVGLIRTVAQRAAAERAGRAAFAGPRRAALQRAEPRAGTPAERRVRDRPDNHDGRNMDTLDRQTPAWLQTGESGFSVEVLNPPLRAHIDDPVQEHLNVELYST